ncbi:MAG: Holliday junction branch migration protein RuvA [Candidatus Neomarinimicrobiota bacterium]
MSLIDSIRGRLFSKNPTFVIIDINGIRLRLSISISTFESLPDKGSQVELLTYLHVREDILDLYAFKNEAERELYFNLNTISGIGPRSAMNILSGTNPEEFKQRIILGDVKSLTVIPGIGLKTAKRIIVELKEKFSELKDGDIDFDFLSPEVKSAVGDAARALTALGYKRSQISHVLKAMEAAGELKDSLDIIIKNALAKM